MWANEIDDNSYYECYFNLSEKEQTIKLNLDISDNQNIRDLWEKKDLGKSTQFTLAPHSCKALKISF